MSSILIVSAWLPEQEELRLRAKKLAHHKIKFALTGIGSIAASSVVTENIMANKFDLLLFCATAGCYLNSFELNSVQTCSSVTFNDAASALNMGYLPPNGPTTLSSEALNSQVLDIKVTTQCVSTPSITTDTNLAKKFSSLGRVENLELYGVALAAASFKLPWLAFLGIANEVGPSAHKEWKQHHKAASLAAQEKLYAAISGGVGGSSFGL